MSTKCQVAVVADKERFTLYHHWDGYPSNMVPLIKKAYDLCVAPHEDYKHCGEDFRFRQAYEVGYSASFLCASDPRGFCPLAYNELHGDLSYYYEVFVGREWEIKIYSMAGKRKKILLEKTLISEAALRKFED